MASYMPTYAAKAFQVGGASGGAGIVVGTDTFKLALITSAIPTAGTRDLATEYYAGADFTEVAANGSYSTGGVAVAIAASQPAIYTTGSVHYATVAASAANASWATTTLAAVLGGILYDNTSSTKWVVAVYDFGGSQSVTSNTFQVNFTSSYPTNTLWYLSCN